MKNKLKKYNDTVIHCPTKELSDKVLVIADILGCKWENNNPLTIEIKITSYGERYKDIVETLPNLCRENPHRIKLDRVLNKKLKTGVVMYPYETVITLIHRKKPIAYIHLIEDSDYKVRINGKR